MRETTANVCCRSAIPRSGVLQAARSDVPSRREVPSVSDVPLVAEARRYL